jgi:viroplasmin and RNaseH domain-containing protein
MEWKEMEEKIKGRKRETCKHNVTAEKSQAYMKV